MGEAPYKSGWALEVEGVEGGGGGGGWRWRGVEMLAVSSLIRSLCTQEKKYHVKYGMNY